MEEKRHVQLGRTQINIDDVARDTRGVEDMLVEILENEWGENRYRQFGAKLRPFSDAYDIAEWDDFLLNRYSPLYTDPQDNCVDCHMGPCNLDNGKGRCGLTLESLQGRLSLRAACRGSLSQMMDSRELLDYAVKVFGREKPASMGKLLSVYDAAPSIGVMTGIHVKTIGDLETALSYAEAQLTKLLSASYSGTGSPKEFEELTFQAGSMLFLAMDVSESIKIACFGFTSAADQDPAQLHNYPLVNVKGGLGNVNKEKPVIAFAGDSFLAAWTAITRMKEKGITEQFEICGIGSVGHDVVRFYEECRIVASMVHAEKTIRTGFADVIVASSSCIPIDIVNAAKRVDSRLIWTSRENSLGLADRTDDPVEEIVADLIKGGEGAWIRDVEKAGIIALEVASKVKRSGNHTLSGDAAKKEASKCRDDCDLCFNACPNALPVSKAIKTIAGEGLKALFEVEKGCYLCGKCEQVCPAGIRLTDLIVAAQAKSAPEDKFVMRAGRGPTSGQEARQGAFSIVFGNAPGFVFLQGCGDAGIQSDIGDIAHELAFRNCFIWAAGCGAADLGRHFDESTQKSIYQEFVSDCEARSLMNCGGCSAHVHIMDMTLKLGSSGGGVPHYANYVDTADYNHLHHASVAIIWGALPERAYAMAASYARNGVPVIVGPASGFQWKRYLLGNKYDRSKWWLYDGFDGRIREVEPEPRNLIMPAETKEEVITQAMTLMNRPLDLRDNRGCHIEHYVELYEQHFGELPDDWQFLLRSDMEFASKQKVRLLHVLRDKYGWEIERLRIKKAKHRDGRLLPMEEYMTQYALESGRYATAIERLVMKIQEEGAES